MASLIIINIEVCQGWNYPQQQHKPSYTVCMILYTCNILLKQQHTEQKEKRFLFTTFTMVLHTSCIFFFPSYARVWLHQQHHFDLSESTSHIN